METMPIRIKFPAIKKFVIKETNFKTVMAKKFGCCMLQT